MTAADQPTPVVSGAQVAPSDADVQPMQRGKTDAETCQLNGWTVGTRLDGDEGYGPTVIQITAIGERDILAKRVSHNGKDPGWDREGNWTLEYREWRKVGQAESVERDKDVAAAVEAATAPLRAEVERLRSPFPCCEHCPDDPEYHAENPPNSHDASCTTCERTMVPKVERDAANAKAATLAAVVEQVRALAWSPSTGSCAGIDPMQEGCFVADVLTNLRALLPEPTEVVNHGAIARGEALAAGYPDWMNVTTWPLPEDVSTPRQGEAWGDYPKETLTGARFQDPLRPAATGSDERRPEGACVHCGVPLDLKEDEKGWGRGWGLHASGSHRGLSRCGSESGQPYGLNGHTDAVPCEQPCAGSHTPRTEDAETGGADRG